MYSHTRRLHAQGSGCVLGRAQWLGAWRVPPWLLHVGGKQQTPVPARDRAGAAHLAAPPWPWALQGVPLPWPTSQPLLVLPTPGTDWHPQGRVQAHRNPFPAGPGVCHVPVPTHTSPGAPQREEKSLAASAQSATLSNLRPDTEYVVMLRPRYAQQPAVPATLTARTRKYCAQPWAQLGLGTGSQHRDAPLLSLCPIGMGLPGPLLPVVVGWGCR